MTRLLLPLLVLLALAALKPSPRDHGVPAGERSAPAGAVADAAGREWHPPARPAAPPRATRSRAPQPRLGLPAVLLRIRWCESHDDYRAENRHSTASGAFQVLDGTWHRFGGYRRAKHAPRRVQDAQALELYRDRGTQPWNASRRCWSAGNPR